MSAEQIDGYIKKVLAMFDEKGAGAFITRLVRKNYNQGISDVETSLDLSFNVVPHGPTVQFLETYAFDLVKGMKEDIAKQLRNELTQAILNKEGAYEIQKRVKSVMDVSLARAAAIARTESHRAYNMGGLNAAKQSGLKLKKIVHNPSPKSDICKTLIKKDPIGIDDSWKYDGKEYLNAPFHVNCRSRVLYVQEDDE